MPSTIDRALRLTLYGAIFATPFVPLLLWRDMFFPFVTSKAFAFRILVEIMTAAWLVRAIANPQMRPPRSTILGAFATFVAIVAVADLMGANPARSLGSNFERMDGLIGLVHLLAFLVVLASTLQTERHWRALIATSIGASALVAAYALVQLAGIWPTNDRGPRVDATFGNPGYLSVHMLLHMFLSALMLTWSRSSADATFRRSAMTLLWSAVMVLHAVVLVASAARASFVGLAIGLVAVTVCLAISREAPRGIRRIAAGLMLAGVIGIGSLTVLKDTPLVQSIQPLRRMVEAAADRNVTTRLFGWQLAIKGAVERPLIGWGQENFNVVFNRHYDPRMHDQDPWLDRVHNVVLDWLVAAGLIGLAAYLAIHAASLAALWRGNAFTPPERLILTGLLVSYFTQNLFTFDVVTTYLVWAMMLAFIARRVAAAHDAQPIISAALPARWQLPTAAALAAIPVAVGILSTLPALRTNLAAAAALRIKTVADLDFARFEPALAHETFGTQEIRERLADAALFASRSARVSEAMKARGMTLATAQMEKQRLASPLDARTELYMGELHMAAGDREKASQAFERALALSPAKQLILVRLAFNEEWRAQKERALDLYKRAFELDPSYLNGRIQYVAILIRAGNLELADHLMQPLIDAGKANDPNIINALEARGDKARIDRIRQGSASAIAPAR